MFHIRSLSTILRSSLHESNAENHPIINDNKKRETNIKLLLISDNQYAEMPATENATQRGITKFFKVDENIVVLGRPRSPIIWHPK